MIRTKKEKFLVTVVVMLALGFGGNYIYQNYGEQLGMIQADRDAMIERIREMQDIRRHSGEILVRFEAMENALKLEGSDSEQDLAFRQEITQLLERVGVQYGQITPREPRREPDFKILSYNIEQIVCTPRQFGQILYEMELQSQVIEVERYTVQNAIGDTGQASGQFRDAFNLASENGLITVQNLQISRLVEYRPGEAPQRTAQRSRS